MSNADWLVCLLFVLLIFFFSFFLGALCGRDDIRSECKTYHEIRIDGKKYTCSLSAAEQPRGE